MKWLFAILTTVGLVWFCNNFFTSSSTSINDLQGITDVPTILVCSTVNRLNIRSGPGTTYEIVGVLTYDQCAVIQSTNSDQTWVEIDDGWVSAQYLTQRTGIPIPTEQITPSPITSKITPVPFRLTEQTPTRLPITEPPAVKSIKLSRWITNLKANLTQNWMFGLLLVTSIYIGLISSRKFDLKRRWINLIISVVTGFLITFLWGNPQSPLYVPAFPKSLQLAINTAPIIMLVGYIAGSILGALVYRKPRQKEHMANTPCHLCGTLQRTSRLVECAKCHKQYCNFPTWHDNSVRHTIDSIVFWIAAILFLFLTAISILGGIIVLAILSIPYFMFRDLLPEGQKPLYWRNCGRDGLCQSCYAIAHPVLHASSITSDNSTSYSDSTSSNSYDDRFYQREDDRDDDDDDDEGTGSIWDGTILKWK